MNRGNEENIIKIRNRGKFYMFVKRVFDFTGSLTMLIILLPVFLVLTILVKAEDGGNVFYKHQRVGKNGNKIGIYKFRSMKKNADKLEEMLTPEQLEEYRKEFKIENDPRITKIGGFLRSTSLDELPQLLNIIKGELSVVGPRPVIEQELQMYGEADRQKFLSVKPGLTGYWQAYARNNATYESGERQKMELYYVDNACVSLDIKVMFKTIFAVLKKEGAS